YTVILTVNDTDGDLSIFSMEILILDDLQPISSFNMNFTTIIEGQYIEFTDTTTGGNNPLLYQWNFGDGTSNFTLQNPIHQFTSEGIYKVVLTVTDLNGDVSVYSTTINVLETQNLSLIDFIGFFVLIFGVIGLSIFSILKKRGKLHIDDLPALEPIN
ncbi:MAG: PKD domain-containing protein, partial [archaeon]|nr:PKD domain-containing protein [archaeon]